MKELRFSVCKWALQPVSCSCPVCCSPFLGVHAGLSPEPGQDEGRAGRYFNKSNAAVGFHLRSMHVSFHSLALPGPGPVYQTYKPSPALLSQLSPALTGKK